MTAIYRYQVPVDDLRHRFGLVGDPLAVGLREPRVVEFWALHDDNSPARERSFLVVGTGHPLPLDYMRHWGSAYDMGGALVWHLIEVPS